MFDPDEFFRFAAAIVRDPGANEAGLRSATSRAYYSTFLVARDALFGPDQQRLTSPIRKGLQRQAKIAAKKKRQTPDTGSHDLIIFAVGQQKTTLATQLSQLKEARVKADYFRNPKSLDEVGKTSWREYAEESVALASQVLPSLKRLVQYSTPD